MRPSHITSYQVERIRNGGTEDGYLDFPLLALGAAVSALVMWASGLGSLLCHYCSTVQSVLYSIDIAGDLGSIN